MNIVDATVLIELSQRGLKPAGNFYATEEVLNEFSNGNTSNYPCNVLNIIETQDIDLVKYLANYKFAMQRFKSFNLYAMRGLGDLSIIASVKTLLEKTQISLLSDDIKIITNDDKLTNAINKLFGDQVSVVKYDNFFITK